MGIKHRLSGFPDKPRNDIGKKTVFRADMAKSLSTPTRNWLGFSAVIVLLYVFLATAVASHAQEPEPPAFFPIITEKGVFMPRNNGEKATGQAWGDYNQDGWLDLYLTDPAAANVLLLNNQDGTFSISPHAESVALVDYISAGAQFVDYDNDGWPDLYVMNWGENVLFHNEQGNGFTDVTAVAGVGNAKNGKTASWGDYDQDGYLDLYVANWACSPRCPRPGEGDKDRLYHNNGDGTFSDVTDLLGHKVTGAGFVAAFVDYDNDGDLDIYLVNDEFINPIGNVLWRNDGPGCDGWCFSEISQEAGADTTVMGMGLATADYDQDGDFDFYFSNAGPMTLLQNQGDGTFTNVAATAGVEYPDGIGWGTVFFDYNNDGFQDLYLAIMEGSSGNTSANPLFRNEGDGTFTNLGNNSGAADRGRTIGVAYADYDRDGWVDLIIGNYDEGYVLYHNIAGEDSGNNWLTLKLVGADDVNRDAVGARVVVTDNNGRLQTQEVKNGSSLGSGNPLELYFGLGQADISNVNIRWPDGTIQDIGSLAANQYHEIVYGEIPATPAPVATAIIEYELESTAEAAATTAVSSGNSWNIAILIFVTLIMVIAAIVVFGLFLFTGEF